MSIDTGLHIKVTYAGYMDQRDWNNYQIHSSHHKKNMMKVAIVIAAVLLGFVCAEQVSATYNTNYPNIK